MESKLCVLLFLFHFCLLVSFGSRDGCGLAVAQAPDADAGLSLNADSDADDDGKKTSVPVLRNTDLVCSSPSLPGPYARRVRKPFQPMRFGKRLSVVNKDRLSQLFKDFPKENTR